MKPNSIVLAALAGVVLCVSSLRAEDAAPRIWTDVQGRKIEATFVVMTGDVIVLQTKAGAVYNIPAAKLSAADQEFAKTATPSGGVSMPVGAAASTPSGKIDALVAQGIIKANISLAKEQKPMVKPNPMATDEQLVRRLYLDITGRIPSHEETVAFLKSSSPTKRADLIDKLLQSDGYVSHMYNYFADMLRIKDQVDNRLLKGLPYIKWLKDSLAENKGWDKMSYELMTAEGKLWNNGAAGYLLRDAGMPLDNLSNTLSVFLGTDVACAQCHDHPFADWTQIQFYEMASFFGATETKRKVDTKGIEKEMTYLIEKNMKPGEDAMKTKNAVRNQMRAVTDLLGANKTDINDGSKNNTKLPADYKYKDHSANEAVAPKFVTWVKGDEKAPAYKQDLDKTENLRVAFAKWMTDKTNPRFAMTIANRMWARAMGVGLTQAVTNIDDVSKSYNPELLKHLASEMARLNYNMKEFQRIIYNTQTYQREATTYEIAMGEPYYFQGPMLRRMSAEQAWDSYMTLVLGDSVDKVKGASADPYGRSLDLDLEKTTVQSLASKLTAFQKLGAAERARLSKGGLAAAGKKMEDEEDEEMMGGSILQYGNMKLMRASELEQPAPAGHFLRDFGQSDRNITDGSAKDGSVPQVLVMMNGKAQSMMTDKDSLMFRTMEKGKTPMDKVEAIYLSVINRKPTMREKQILDKELKAHGESAYPNIIWALINTREFTFIQ